MSIVYIFPRKNDVDTLFHYEKLLRELKKEEQCMKNPLLRDWFKIRNEIRYLERKIREMKNNGVYS